MIVCSRAMVHVACGLTGHCALKRAMNRTTTNLNYLVELW